jgi:hypothetical protein
VELDRIKARLAVLEGLVERTADAFDQNTTIYQDSFQTIEAQTHVTQRILSEIACGGDLYVAQDPGGKFRLDFGAYFFEYMFCLHFGQWVRDFCNVDRPADTDPAPPPPPEETPGVFVFGG